MYGECHEGVARILIASWSSLGLGLHILRAPHARLALCVYVSTFVYMQVSSVSHVAIVLAQKLPQKEVCPLFGVKNVTKSE